MLKQQCPICRQHTDKQLPLLTDNKKGTKDGRQQPDFVPFHNMHVQLHEKQYSEVLPFILASIATYDETSKNDTLLYLSYYAKGSFYRKKGLKDQSLESMLEAEKISKSIENPPGSVGFYSDIANLFFELQHYEEALQYYLDLLHKNDFSANKKLQGAVYNNIARCYATIESHDYEKAEFYYKKSLDFYGKFQDSLNLSAVHLNLGDLYFEQYKDRKAIVHLKKALLYSDVSEASDIKDDIYFNLSLAMESAGETEKALEFYKKYVEQLEGIWNRDKVWRLAEQEKKFVVDKKQTEIKLLEKEAKLQKMLLEAKRQQSNTFFSIASALLLLLLIALYSYQQRIKKNRVIATQNLQLDELNKTKDRLFSIIAHDLRTPVHLLKESNLKLKNAFVKNEPSIVAKQLEFNIRMTENTYSMLDNLLYWSLEQKKGTFFKKEQLPLSPIVEQVLMNYSDALIMKNIALEKNIPEGIQIYADSNAIKIVLRNIIDNAIKFTHEGGSITIDAHVHENQAGLVVQDNGIGINKTALDTIFNSGRETRQKDTSGRMSTGLGLELCRIMTEKNGGELFLESEEGKGTTVRILFELVKN